MNSRILGASIIIPIFVVSIGIFMYNSATSTITDTISTISTQEIEAFNNQFSAYEGSQTGSNIKALMGRLIGNADEWKDDHSKVPQVYINCISSTMIDSIEATYTESDSENPQEYIVELGKIRNKVETKHEYFVEFNYQDNGLIDYIIISYDPNNPSSAYMHR